MGGGGGDGKDRRRGRTSVGALLDAHEEGAAGAGYPAVLLGERNAEDSVRREERFDVLRILGLLVDLGGARSDPVLDELPDRVPDRDLILGEVEIHQSESNPNSNSSWGRSSEQVARDDDSLDLVRALVDLQ